MSTPKRIVALSLVLAAGLWLLDALLVHTLSPDSTFMEALIGLTPCYDLITRIAVTVCLVSLGIALHAMTARQARLTSELTASQSKFEDLYQNAPNACFSVGIDGKILRCNHRTRKLLGYTGDELIGRSVFELYAEKPDGKEKAKALFSRFQQGESFEGEELQMRKADGSIIWISLTINTIRDENGKVVESRSVVSEITDRKQMDRHRAFTQFTVDQAKIAVFWCDSDGWFFYVNDTACEWLQYSREELLKMHVADINPVFPREAWGSHWQDIKTHGLVRLESVHRRKNGEIYPVDIYSNYVQFEGKEYKLAFVHDITESKRAAEERRRLAAVVEQSAESVIVTDPEGTIEYVNPAFERITGYTRDEAIGMNPRMLKSGTHDDAFYKELWDTINSGKVWSGRMTNRKKDGTLYHQQAVISAIRDEEGKTVNFVGVGHDVTKEEGLEEQLRQAQKMEAVGQLAGGIAHDFNNLLQAINGHADLALSEVSQEASVREDLEGIAKAGRRAARLVGQLLAFSRRQLMAPEYLDLNDTIEELIEMLRRVIGETIELSFRRGNESSTVYADRGMVEQVLMNLAVNARDAMPNGGSLSIETEGVTIDDAFVSSHPWAQVGRFVLLNVRDTGGGIAEENLKRIFEPFFTTKDTGKGTGLGLSTVYGIVKQHSGMIRVNSELEQGTVFRIYLPSVESTVQVAASVTEGAVPRGTETVLVAEDDATVRLLAQKLLQNAGYTVLLAQDGLEAVELFQAHSSTIDVLVLDVVMPRLGGRAAYERISEVRHSIPVLYATGYSEDALHTDFVLDNGVSVIQKPYSREKLLRSLRKVIEEARI